MKIVGAYFVVCSERGDWLQRLGMIACETLEQRRNDELFEAAGSSGRIQSLRFSADEIRQPLFTRRPGGAKVVAGSAQAANANGAESRVRLRIPDETLRISDPRIDVSVGDIHGKICQH